MSLGGKEKKKRCLWNREVQKKVGETNKKTSNYLEPLVWAILHIEGRRGDVKWERFWDGKPD